MKKLTIEAFMHAMEAVKLKQKDLYFVYVLYVKEELKAWGYDVSLFDKIFKGNPEG